jgi:hypothetical protein
MPGFIVHMGAVVQCSHGGQAMPTVTSPSVTVSGQPIATLASLYAIAGCTLQPPAGAPCVSAQWVVGATRVTSDGQPVLVEGGQALVSPTPAPLLVVTTQTRVTAT